MLANPSVKRDHLPALHLQPSRTLLILACALATSLAFAEPARNHQLTLPLSGQTEALSVPLGQGVTLVARPDQEGWEIAATESFSQGEPTNLLYHSQQWHGPYPNQVYAWHLLKHQFPNTRWLCVAGHPIELKLQVLDAKVRPAGETAVFERGRLRIEWFYRPCTKGFGHERLAP